MPGFTWLSAQTGYYVRWNGSRWVSSYIQPTDVPALPFAGDLSGNQYGATVTGLQGVAVGSTAPTTGQYFKFNGSTWAGSAIQASDLPSLSGTYVDLSSNQTVGGAKTFSSALTANSGVVFGDGKTQLYAAPKVLDGVLNPNGTANRGTGFTATRDSAGTYTVSWPAGTFPANAPLSVPIAQCFMNATTTITDSGNSIDGSGWFTVSCGGKDSAVLFTVTQAQNP
jgi:hypothetical protein